MKRAPQLFLLLAAFALVATAAASAPVSPTGGLGLTAVQVTITELPPLPGQNISAAFQLNDRNVVVGFSELFVSGQPDVPHPVYWANPPTRALPQPAGTDSGEALAINNAGLIAGFTGPSATRQATQWSRNVPKVLGGFPGGGRSAIAGLTDRGYGVGTAVNAFGARRAAFWIGGRVLDMGTLTGFPESVGNFVNNFNVSTGRAIKPGQGRAILWNGTHPEAALGELPGGLQSEGYVINDFNEVGGYSGAADGHIHATLWRPGFGPEALPGPPAGSDSYVGAINNRGIMSGFVFNDPLGPERGVLWVDGTFFELESLIPASLGWSHLDSFDANEKDQIVGIGIRNGAVRGFALGVRRL